MKKTAVLIFFLTAAFAFHVGAQTKQIVLHVTFNGNVPDGVQVIPAILKYDKDFAFSFTFDDAYKDAYSLGYKLLSGGQGSDGLTYPGLFFTDGCGSRIPFRAGIAWYTANLENLDLHFNTPGNLTYSDAVELYHSGWDFFNHSYNHESNVGNLDFNWQISANHQAFKTNTGIDFNYFVTPSGDAGYLEPAFLLGSLACFTSSQGAVNTGIPARVTQPVASAKPVYWRHVINSDEYTPAQLKEEFSSWARSTGPGNQQWRNEFTHRVDYGHIGSSVEFPAFREYFEYIERTYGRGGLDNGWIASSAEVFDYLKVRDQVVAHLLPTGGQVMDIILDFSGVPSGLRYYDLSLLIKSPGDIVSVHTDMPETVKHANTGRGHLVNLKLTESQINGANLTLIDNPQEIRGYPNPVNGRFNILLPENLINPEVRIRNILAGSVPCPDIIEGNGILALDFKRGSYSPGLYIISVYESGRCIGSMKVLLN